MKIVTLMENTACREDLAREHGLSLYIETEGKKILFDAGQSAAFADNAEKLGVSLSEVDFAILSHGHYDHGGGLRCFLETNEAAPVYINQHAFAPHYNARDQYIGLDRALMENHRLCFVDDKRELAPGITLHTVPFAPADTSGLQRLEDGVLLPEDFRHEQYLLVEENGKRFLFSGCSHKGILQIAEHFRPDVLVGGFHFMKIDDPDILIQSAKKLLAYDTVYYTGHCTGLTQYACLKQIMGDRLCYLAAGSCVAL